MIRYAYISIGILLMLLTMSFGASMTYAQLNTMVNTGGTITVNVNPPHPEEGAEVTVSLNSFFVDLDSRRITWRINGEPVANEVGKKEYTLTMGNTGERKVVDIRIILPAEVVEKRVILSPGGLDVLWEAPDAYIPPFYRGKALPSRESRIRTTSIPRIQSFPNPESVSDHVFTWEQNYTVRGSLSGFGRDSFEFINRLTNSNEVVGVTMRNPDTGFSAQKHTPVIFVDSEILFYRDDPELGVRPQALSGNIATQRGSINLIAEPYYFSPHQGNVNNLEFNWRSGNQRLLGRNNQELGRVANIQSSREGRTFITVEVENMARFLQFASNSIQVTFR